MTEIEPNTLERLAKMLDDQEKKLQSLNMKVAIQNAQATAYNAALANISNIMERKDFPSKQRKQLFDAMKPIRDLYDSMYGGQLPDKEEL